MQGCKLNYNTLKSAVLSSHNTFNIPGHVDAVGFSTSGTSKLK